MHRSLFAHDGDASNPLARLGARERGNLQALRRPGHDDADTARIFVNLTISEDRTGTHDEVMSQRLAPLARHQRSPFDEDPKQELTLLSSTSPSSVTQNHANDHSQVPFTRSRRGGDAEQGVPALRQGPTRAAAAARNLEHMIYRSPQPREPILPSSHDLHSSLSEDRSKSAFSPFSNLPASRSEDRTETQAAVTARRLTAIASDSDQKPNSMPPQRPTLLDVLKNIALPPYTLAAFIEFLSQQHCQEVLAFFSDALRYKSLFEDAVSFGRSKIHSSTDEGINLIQTWTNLLDVYVKAGAPQEINLPIKERDDLVEYPCEPTAPSPKVLDPAMVRMYNFMADSIFVPFCKEVEKGHDPAAKAKVDLVKLDVRNSGGSFTAAIFKRDGTEEQSCLSEGFVQLTGLTHHVKRRRVTYAANYLDAHFRFPGQNKSNIERFSIVRDAEIMNDGVLGSVFLQKYSRLLASNHESTLRVWGHLNPEDGRDLPS
jgi:hypothetical protein